MTAAIRTKSTHLDLPGYMLPLNYTPRESSRKLFPNALDASGIEEGWASRIYVHREILMMQVMNTITDKPEWERKVFEDDIVAKWREEIAGSGHDITPNMMDWIIEELQWKASIYRETGYVVAYQTGVVKSDSAIPRELKEFLRQAVRSLEHVPEKKKDYHPGSDKQVVDLVHPSLFPVIYGRSRILPDRLIGVDDCLDSVGQGEQLAVPPKNQALSDDPTRFFGREWAVDPFSRKFQWMPCDVDMAGECHIASYINNLHPEKNRSLYEVIEKILSKTIPLWDSTLTHVGDNICRMPYHNVELEPLDPEPEEPDEADEDAIDEYYQQLESAPIELPEPGTFEPPIPRSYSKVDLRTQYQKEGLQVIVKLANIELTPEKPDYNGGSWHIEGQSNEHICATALYYYDSDNITENHLSFRQRADDNLIIDYPQDRHDFLQSVFGFPPDIDGRNGGNITQALGNISTREGRLLTFPNILQHRVSPFSLADKSKPGHRKIIAFFLVDPHMRIISSANIPPQNTDWWTKRHEVINQVMGNRLPAELQYMINENVDAGSITMDEAKEYRLQLMEERSSMTVQRNEEFESGNFNLCEH
ncbi:hypothetical protein P170DRAFT_433346, partial [Aspergillus steynii IBT 23096]